MVALPVAAYVMILQAGSWTITRDVRGSLVASISRCTSPGTPDPFGHWVARYRVEPASPMGATMKTQVGTGQSHGQNRMKTKLIDSTPVAALRRIAEGIGIAWLALALNGSLTAAEKPAAPPTIGVVVLPFQNATGDDAWDDWRQSLPALVRSCLDQAEFTRIPRWKTIQPALVRAGWTTTTTVDAKLARQMAQELKADVVVWGSFRHLTNGWAAEAKVLRAGSEAAPVELSFTSPRWVDLAESLALGLAKQLGCPIADVDRQRWRMLVTDSEQADGSLAKAIALETQKAPVADQEQAWREVLAADPRCG